MPKSQIDHDKPKKKSFFKSEAGLLGGVLFGVLVVVTAVIAVTIFPPVVLISPVIAVCALTVGAIVNDKSNKNNQANKVNKQAAQTDENSEYIEQSPSKFPSLNGRNNFKPLVEKPPEKRSWVSRLFGSSKTNVKER